MDAKKLSEALKAKGLAIGEVAEPDDAEDGMIKISTRVHVQVPFWTNEPNVVRETADTAFIFGKPRTDLDTLVDDIRRALRAEAQEASKGKNVRTILTNSTVIRGALTAFPDPFPIQRMI